jgi:hypothetical protein
MNSPSATAEAASTSGGQVLAARVALVGTAAVALLLLLLHVVKPQFHPSWRFISEYSIGANGWIMMLAFFVWAASMAALFVALSGELRSRTGRIGNYLLLVVALSLIVAGLFAADPVTTKPGETTQHGSIHGFAAMVGIPGIPIAALLITYSLVRRNPSWARYRARVMWLAHFTWISLAAMAIYLAIAVPKAGGFTPDVWAGWFNRIVVAAYLLWQAAIAYRIVRR